MGNTFGQNLDDSNNYDSDDKTDKVIEFNWLDFGTTWGQGEEASTLANITFQVADGADLSSSVTSISITSRDPAPSYNFYGKDLTISQELKEKIKPFQKVYALSEEITFLPGEDVSFDLLYTTSDNENELSGLGLQVHYDSSIFTPLGENNGVTTSLTTIGISTNDLSLIHI